MTGASICPRRNCARKARAKLAIEFFRITLHLDPAAPSVAPRHSEDAALTSVALPEAGRSPLPPASGPAGSIADTLDPAIQKTPLLQKILDSLDDLKAENVVVIDLAGKTSLADTMAIATGRSNTHVGAIAERVIKACKETGVAAPRVEGMPHNDWVLVDTGDLIVHIFRPEVRQFYNLEKMWSGDRPTDKSVGKAVGVKPVGAKAGRKAD
ncbi:MAG: ribosome silencing factor [Methylobacteriaceae bacterium]|nr:ribosome silencing factor [Rhodoblastus sp.]MCC0004163.1 ribosome silencing factor [Methylobacteriaceae bacterium]